jgi:cobalt-zinc-cadmium efflux system membrane fusion protein
MDTMTRKHGLWIAVTLALAVAVFGGVRTMAQDHDAEVATHDEHDDHDEHAEGEEHDDHDDHAEGETADEHAGHDDHVDIVKLSEAEMAEFGIRLAVAKSGSLANSTSLPGEITLDEDRLAHVTPRVAGTVREVYGHLGDHVSAGDPMAVLDSAEMGAAIVAYLSRELEVQAATSAVDIAKAGVDIAISDESTRQAAVDVAQTDLGVARDGLGVTEDATSLARAALERQATVTSNTTALLAALGERLSVEELDERLTGKDTGANRATLLVAYADLLATETELERETALHEQGISSASEVVAARQARRNARSTYEAARDEVAYEVGASLLAERQQVKSAEQDAATSRQVIRTAEQTVRGMEQALLQAEQAVREAEQAVRIAELGVLTAEANAKGAERALHVLGMTDEEIATIHESGDHETDLTRFVLRAPFDGTVVQKHIAIGEYVEPGADLYQVADLSSVWVNLTVYQKDLPYVDVGQDTLISAGHTVESARGVISYISPTVDKATRTARARVVLSNEHGVWRPGLFVTGAVLTSESDVASLVPRTALQTYEGKLSVFVLTPEGFEPHPVVTGRANDTHVEVVSGLPRGSQYAATGAFTLKAQLAKGGFGDGHAH